MRRDRMTFGMMVGIPLLQLVLFGFAINSDPKHLPTAILQDRQRVLPHARWGLRNSGYFTIVRIAENEAEEIETLLSTDGCSLWSPFPTDFSRDRCAETGPGC